MEQLCIKNFTLPELESWVESIGEKRFRARQLFKHIYNRGITSWNECSDLSKPFRVQLELGTSLNALKTLEKLNGSDGTVKYLFGLPDGHAIESVLIPDLPRRTLCISSQVGCAMGCAFCLTGSLGFKRNLTAGEIIDQVCQVQQDIGPNERITNLVLMGMGEPLANYSAVIRAMNVMIDPTGLAFSHRRITLSTIGLTPQLARLGKDSPVNLAISLHAPDDELRNRIMPVNRAHPLQKLMEACRAYPIPPRKRITFEYILLDDFNDSPKQAKALLKLLKGIRAKVNLIPFNSHPNADFHSPSQEKILAFQEVLHGAGLTATIRQSRGADIGAACGQLAARDRGELIE